MDRAETVTLTFPPEVAAQLRDAAAASGLATISDLVSQAVEEWRANHGVETRSQDELRRLIQEGIDSGHGIPADEVFDRLIAKYEGLAVR